MIIYRTYQPEQTIGKLCFEGFELATIELAWNDNKKRISCIPEGKYQAVPRYSEKYGNHFHVLNVPCRSMILFHKMNYHFQGLGCIGVGMKHADINKDGLVDTVQSGKALNILLEKFPNGFEFEIKKDE